MKYNMKQRLEMAYHGVDADELENTKQQLPSLEDRMDKLERYIDRGHPRSNKYEEQLRVYKTLKDPQQAKDRKAWNRVWGWLNG